MLHEALMDWIELVLCFCFWGNVVCVFHCESSDPPGQGGDETGSRGQGGIAPAQEKQVQACTILRKVSKTIGLLYVDHWITTPHQS